MIKRFAISFIYILFFLSAKTQNRDSIYKPVEYPAGYTAKLNLVYVMVNNWEGKVDLYLPPKAGNPSPLIINIHGGGWNKGVKESQTGFSTFFKAGFAVANIEYRLSPQAAAPAAIEDTRCALIYLIRNARELNIDVNKIVLMGSSSGGHLALMTGLLCNDRRFDNNCKGNDNIKVAAIINKYGITDVWDWGYGKNRTSKSAIQFLGDKAKDEMFAKSISPINYVTKNSPPVFIVHGNADPTVPYQHSVDLYQKLLKEGVNTEFITVAGGLHGNFEKEKNSEINKSIMNFILSLNNFK